MRDLEEVICPCFDITYGDIVKAVKEKKLKTLEEIMEETEAGTLCGGCLQELEELLEELLKEE